MTQRAGTATPRNRTVDVARGVGITLMVFGHVVDGLALQDALDPGFVHWAQSSLHTFRMPLFFILAGVFLPQATAKRGPGRFIRLRATTLLWPFVMWTLLTAGIRTVVGDAANHGAPTLQEIALGLVWQPINQYWYLPALLLSTISVVLLRRVFPPPWSAAGPVVVAVAMWIAGGYLDVGMFQFLHWTIYVAIGAAAGPAIGAVSGWATGRLWGTFAAGVAGFVLAVLVLAPTGALAVEVHVAFLLCAVLGVTWMLALAALIDRTIAGKPVAQVGTWSLHVFLMHVIFYAGSRIMLRSVGVSSPILLVVAGVIAGVGGPCLVAWLALRSLWTRWLFDPPMLRHDLHTRSSARVAEVGSFADAGQREPVLHPSLSTSLDQLEALSADLVDRGSQAVRGCGDRSRDRFRDQATDGCRDADPGAHCCGSVGLRDHG